MIFFSLGQLLCFLPLKSCKRGFLSAASAHNTENLERMADRKAKEEVNRLKKGQIQLHFMGAYNGGENLWV